MVLTLLLGVGLVAGNNVMERRELDRLLARVVAAQDTIAYSNRRMAATVDYTEPLQFRANLAADVRSGLRQLVADSAAGQVGDMAQERARVADVSVLPWHRALRKAKAALVAYLDAHVAFLRAVASNTHALYVVHPELDHLLADAREAFRTAAGATASNRVNAAFAGGAHPA